MARDGQERGPDDERGGVPRLASRSGAEDRSTTPNARPASRVSHMPAGDWGSAPRARGPRRLRRRSLRGGHRNATTMRTAPITAAAANAGPVPDLAAQRPDHRAEQRTDDHGRAQAGAEQLAAPLGGGGRGDPGHGRGPGARPAQALHEPRRVQHRGGRGEAEDQRGHAHQGQAEHRHRPVAQARAEHPAGQRADQGAQRVGGDQDPRAGLGQPGGVGVVRQQRGQCGEEDRVHQDQRAEEADQHPQPGRELRPGEDGRSRGHARVTPCSRYLPDLPRQCGRRRSPPRGPRRQGSRPPRNPDCTFSQPRWPVH